MQFWHKINIWSFFFFGGFWKEKSSKHVLVTENIFFESLENFLERIFFFEDKNFFSSKIFQKKIHEKRAKPKKDRSLFLFKSFQYLDSFQSLEIQSNILSSNF